MEAAFTRAAPAGVDEATAGSNAGAGLTVAGAILTTNVGASRMGGGDTTLESTGCVTRPSLPQDASAPVVAADVPRDEHEAFVVAGRGGGGGRGSWPPV